MNKSMMMVTMVMMETILTVIALNLDNTAGDGRSSDGLPGKKTIIKRTIWN